MAPRSVKAKKATDVKVSENEGTKKGRGKNKLAPEMEADVEETVEDKIPVTEKKAKRGKKVASGDTEDNQNGEDIPPPKKGKKKNDDEIEEILANDDKSEEDVESVPAEDNEQDDDSEANGHSEEVQAAPTGRGRKKQTKKEPAEKKTKESNKSKKNAKANDTENDNKRDVNEDKPKGRGRGRKAQPKPEVEQEPDDKPESVEEEVKPASSRGRKKAPVKSYKEKTPESDYEESQEEGKDPEEVDEEPKKAARGKKNVGRKAQPKGEFEDNEEEFKEEPATKKQKVTKKEEKGKGGSKDEDDMDEDVPEAKPVKGKRGRKKAVEKPVETEEELQDTGEPTTKRKRKQAEEKASTNETKKTQSKSKNATDYESIDFSNSSKNQNGKEWNLKIASWNVDGIRAWMVKGGLDYLKYEKPDILCLQELKCAKEKLPDEIVNVPGYHAYWLCSDKDGYAGVGIYTTKLAMNVQYGLQDEELDTEGRIITAEYEQFYLICTYVPNSGRKLVTLPKRLKWNEEFLKHVKSLDKKKPVIICGDMNVSHNEIDLTNPKTNRKNAGFTDEERAGMTEMLGEGFVDTYRHLYPDNTGAYTFWTYMFNSRAKNVGWRLDYFIMSERLLPALCDNTIRDKVYGSDHCPVTLFLHLRSADKPKE